MSNQEKNNVMEYYSDNTERYGQITQQIERFIELKKKEPTKISGIVEKVDFDSSVLTIKLLSDNRPHLSKGTFVLIREDSTSIAIRATIIEINKSDIKVEVMEDPRIFEDKKVTIDAEQTNVILERLANVTTRIKERRLNTDSIRILDLISYNNKPKYRQEKIPSLSKKLNDAQTKAVEKSIKAEDFHLIIGPPGTGKTYVIEELIKQFEKIQKKILITAWTNLAVDNIIKRLAGKEKMNLVRMGPIIGIDPEIKEFSIYEKMKKHEAWNEVENLHRFRDGLFKLNPKLKKELDLTKENIERSKNTIGILKDELAKKTAEKEKYENLLSALNIEANLANVPQIDNALTVVSDNANSLLLLCRDVLRMNRLKSKLPRREKLKLLHSSTRRMRLTLIYKKMFSFFSQKNKKIVEKMEKEYTKNKDYLNEVSKIDEEYCKLRKASKRSFNEIYPHGGLPDMDALNLEFKAYKMLKEKYLPALKERELSNSRMSKIKMEVYELHIASLNKNIELLHIKIKGLNTDMDVQINNKNSLCKQRQNVIISLAVYKKNISKLTKVIISEILASADVIASTVVSSCHYYLEDYIFDVMIMDEASQVASFMSLLPLTKCKKFILVGDNKQLQPIEEVEMSKEMNLSIFNRLFDMYPEASTFLPIQYRMHKSIAQIANEIFYEGKLRTSKQAEKRILNLKVGKYLFLNPKIPVVFIDTAKVAYYEDEVGYSCSNTLEGRYVAYITSLFIKKGIMPKDIAIITPYNKQSDVIKKLLSNIRTKGVEVNTIHKFQGREKDIIIMSFSRSKKYSFPLYKLRFIENETLVNVALTRARKKLILVGNSKTLTKSKLLYQVVRKIGEKNRVIL